MSQFGVRGDLSVEELKALQHALFAIKVAALDRLSVLDAEALRAKQLAAKAPAQGAASTHDFIAIARSRSATTVSVDSPRLLPATRTAGPP